ncbi:MAG TPA: hypothetical protein DD405_00825 [Desulfobacteraceae bacterium]|nr:hypothetical protein [Desulfobacteraceae bacterium]
MKIYSKTFKLNQKKYSTSWILLKTMMKLRGALTKHLTNNTYIKIIYFQFLVFSFLCLFFPYPADSKNLASAYPDIKWEPKAFVFKADTSTRYIDYENGSDINPGTKEKPWRHHPWDKAAKWKAAMCKGIHTYCFKKGVIYRGSLIAEESGEPGNPIRLTVDPSWGKEKAGIYGSIRITKGWKRCTDGKCPEIPSEGRINTWYIDLNKSFVPRLVWETHNDKVIRIPIARTPNWKITNPDDPRSEWWELTGCILEVKIFLDQTDGFKAGDSITGTGKWADLDRNPDNLIKGRNRITEITKNYIKIDSWNWKKGEIKAGAQITNSSVKAQVLKISGCHEVISRLMDDKHFNQKDPEYWIGATMWAEKESMPKPDAEKIIGYDPVEHSLRVKYHRGVRGQSKFDRYYLENLPKFLDHPGEYYFKKRDKHFGRLFIRLPKDRNPNLSTLELAKENVLIDIHNKNHIIIAGLGLRFSNTIDCGSSKAWYAPLYASAIRITGICSNIKIINSEIAHVSAGIIAWPKKKGDVFDHIEVSDSHIHDIDSSAIGLSNGSSHCLMKNAGARLIHVNILRNRVSNVGYRVLSHWCLGPHAIHVEGGELVKITGNVVDKCWGAGILAFNGSDYSRGCVERPLMRTLIHHNKVTNSLLGMQDYGGIASWMGGPSYVYCNISGNPVGYKHAHYRKSKKKDWYRTSCFGVGVYFDGQYKGYAFNNIIWGKNNNVNERIYNSCAFKEAMGFLNTVFNNTMYNFGVGIHKDMTQHNRSYYLGNLMLDMGHKFIQHEAKPEVIEYHSLAYANNIFHGEPSSFGKAGWKTFPSLLKWQNFMRSKKVMASQTGVIAKKPQVINAAARDFRLKPDSIAIDMDTKVFVPWGLYKVVGEWGFYHHPADPSIILGENMNWNDEWFQRAMFQDIPRNNLRGRNIDNSDFQSGILENWTKGALKFNGSNQYCEIPDEFLKKGYKWSRLTCKKKPCNGFYNGKKRISLDMGTNNFLIEVIFKTIKGFSNGGIVCKYAEKGYILDIDNNGHARLRLDFGLSECSRSSKTAINDGKWHHLIAEVNRESPEGITIYLDGKISNGQWRGVINNTGSLSNTANFTVGKTTFADEKHFKGIIDFLRISRGTLEDAETTIDELYNWEFDGPFLKDFYGRTPAGKYRDAGAIEYINKKAAD